MAEEFETPLGKILIDQEVMDKLRLKEHFFDLPTDVDEAEHSLEMQLPYIRKMFSDEEGLPHDIKLVPIMVGRLDED